MTTRPTWFSYMVIVSNCKQVQAYRDQIPFTVSLNLLTIKNNYDNNDHMRTKI